MTLLLLFVVCCCYYCYYSDPYKRYSQFSTNSSRAVAFVETISGEHKPSPPASVSLSLDLMSLERKGMVVAKVVAIFKEKWGNNEWIVDLSIWSVVDGEIVH